MTFMGYGFTFRGDNTIKIVLPPSEKGVHLKRKEFAPLGANSPHLEETLFQKGIF